jgi:hypothetical protein
MLSIGLSLVALFTVIELAKASTNFTTFRWQTTIGILIKMIIIKEVVQRSLMIMNYIYEIFAGMIYQTSKLGLAAVNMANIDIAALGKSIDSMSLFQQLITAAQLIAPTLIMNVLTIVSLIVIYGRMMDIYIKISMSPIALSTLSSSSTSGIGRNFLQSFAASCLQGVIIILSLSAYAIMIKTIGATMAAGVDISTLLWKNILCSSLLVFLLTTSGKTAKTCTGLGG